MPVPQFQTGDRVVYKYSGEGAGHPMHDGNTGTVASAGPETARVRWDDRASTAWIGNPYNKNLQPIPLATVTPITTAYEADTHHDDIAHPSHYAAGRKYEPKDVIRDWGLGFNLGAVVKYVARAGRKPATPTLQDLRKARQFLDFEIEALEAEAGK